MNGRHFGVYNLNELSDDESLVHPKGPLQSGSDVDDGYRSLSRNSLKSNVIQQLNDIKSRLIDLVHEIDLCVESKLDREQMEAYQRRRNALIVKLDALIDAHLQQQTVSNGSERAMMIECPANFEDSPEKKQSNLHLISSSSSSSSSAASSSTSASSTGTTASSSSRYSNKLALRRQKSKSFSSAEKPQISSKSPREYEEQVQVIDYNFRRRASQANITELARQSSVTVASAKLEVSSIDEAISRIQSKKGLQIDFGAMMRNYEERQKIELSNYYTENITLQNKPTILTDNQHNASYSMSSNASSSSFL